MKKLLFAAAVGLAPPPLAHAAEAPKMACCEQMKAEGKKCCCDDLDNKDHPKHDKGKTDHAEHNMSKLDHGRR